MEKFKDVNELVNALKPDYPVYCIRPESIRRSTKFFKDNFPGKVLYAVKTNPNERVIKFIVSNGIENFDCPKKQLGESLNKTYERLNLSEEQIKYSDKGLDMSW